jgi:hypothetical protein
MAQNRGSRFWPNCNGLEWRKSVLARLEWLGMGEVGFGLTGMTWKGESWFWPNMEDGGFGLTGIAWNGGSRFCLGKSALA